MVFIDFEPNFEQHVSNIVYYVSWLQNMILLKVFTCNDHKEYLLFSTISIRHECYV